MKLRHAFAGVAWAIVGAVLALGQVPPPGPRTSRPTLFLVGDSTANHGNRLGWGEPFPDYFDLARINIVNRACACSARTFFDESRWNKIMAVLKPGDYVLIQFGHNDIGVPNQFPGRADLPGTGDEAKMFAMPDGKTEMVHTFGWYIRRFVQDAKRTGAYPIVLSPTARDVWTNGKVERGLGDGEFGRWSQAVAEAEEVPFVDVTNIIADVYERIGQEPTNPLFFGDGTHSSQSGADLNASLVVAGLKGIGSPLAQLLTARGEAVVVPSSLGNSDSPVAQQGTFLYLMKRSRRAVSP